MGIDRYVSSDFVSGQATQTGLIGNLYGVDVYVSANCRTIETAANNSAGGDVRAALLFHTDALVMAEQQAVRSQTQYKQEYSLLCTLRTASTVSKCTVQKLVSFLLFQSKKQRKTQGVSMAPFYFSPSFLR